MTNLMKSVVFSFGDHKVYSDSFFSVDLFGLGLLMHYM